MSNGLWLLPSRRRLGKLQTFFDCAMENGMTSAGVVLVQQDELKEFANEYSAIRKPDNWRILPTVGEGLADKCREVFSVVSGFDWVGLACDDLRPQTPEWDKTLIEAINGKNIVTCEDGQQGNTRMAGITLFSGGVLRALGYMFPPNFWHTYADNVWEDIGRGANCWDFVPSVLIAHDHPFTDQKLDPAKVDDTGLKSYGQQQRDAEAYALWCQSERQAAIARVKALCAS